MLSENRKYHFSGELTLNRSRVLGEQTQPKDDEVNWLFLNSGEQQFSFVYKIESPFGTKYNEPFKANLAFTMIEAVTKTVELNQTYQVLRGQEIVGTIRLIKSLE